MTNLEKIRSMSAEEMAEMFYNLSNYGEYCPIPTCLSCRGTQNCVECCKTWLNEETDR